MAGEEVNVNASIYSEGHNKGYERGYDKGYALGLRHGREQAFSEIQERKENKDTFQESFDKILDDETSYSVPTPWGPVTVTPCCDSGNTDRLARAMLTGKPLVTKTYDGPGDGDIDWSLSDNPNEIGYLPIDLDDRDERLY